MGALVGTKQASQNAWRERGYNDGKAKRQQRVPLNASDEERAAYLEGYRHGSRA